LPLRPDLAEACPAERCAVHQRPLVERIRRSDGVDDDGVIGRRYRYDDGHDVIEGVLVDVNYRPVLMHDDVPPEAGSVADVWTLRSDDGTLHQIGSRDHLTLVG
jgi:hypothetical protein